MTTLTKIYLSDAILSGTAEVVTPDATGDLLAPIAAGSILASADLNGDGILDFLVGSPGSDDKDIDAGRSFVLLGQIDPVTGATIYPSNLGSSSVIIDGVVAGDLSGASVAILPSIGGGSTSPDAIGDLVIGAPGLDLNGVDSGGAYVVWGATSGGIDLQDIQDRTKGFLIKGAAAGDEAGTIVAASGDLNGDGKADILVAATGNDSGGTDSGAIYAVFGKSTTGPVNLGTLSSTGRGITITGENAFDHAGSGLASAANLDGAGLQDAIVIGASGNDGAAIEGGAVYVVFPGSTAGTVNLDDVALGTGGFKVSGSEDGLGLGSTVGAIGDVNNDGRTDIFAGAAEGGKAYVVFGKTDTAALTTASLEAGTGGFAIYGEPGQDLLGMSVSGGLDLNGDGLADYVIGVPHDGENGTDAGAVYVVWGGGASVNLADIAAGIGGTKILGTPGSLTGSSVQVVPDVSADGKPDIVIGSSGAGYEQIIIFHAPAEWQPDPQIYGTDNADNIGPGYGSYNHVGDGDDLIYALRGDDTVSAAGGSDTIDGGEGNDILDAGEGDNSVDGGTGADAMSAGSGNDTYYVDDIGDTVTDAGGNDIVVIDASIIDAGWIAPVEIETVVILGTNSVHLTGGSGADNLVGGNGDDVIDGGAGDDMEIGGEGDDTLISTSGQDNLVGGGGNDTYVVSGGRVHIEDFQGDDTIDASWSTTNDIIDLESGHDSSIENEHVDCSGGGTTVQALDVQFLQDLTGSFADDIANVQTLVPQIIAAIQNVQANAEFGVSTFRDKPMGTFGDIADWVFETSNTLSANIDALTASYNAMQAMNGNDEPEAQLEALMQLALHANDIGFRSGSAHMVVLFTDAPFHIAGDGAPYGLVANNGDDIIDGGGTIEDYPLFSQVKAALESAGVIPIFAVANGYEADYQMLATELGRGQVVTLSASSDNIVQAISSGLAAATTTVIENAIGGSGDDIISGNGASNRLEGGDGHDEISGLGGNDTLIGGHGTNHLDGGEGNDTALLTGAFDGFMITVNKATGEIIVADMSNGDVHHLVNIETLSFTDQSVSAADLISSAPETLVVSGPVSVAGAEDSEAFTIDLLANVSGGDPSLSYQAVVDALTLPSGVAFDAALNLLTIDPTSADFQNLQDGEHLALLVEYSITNGNQTALATCDIDLTGVNDAAVFGGAASGSVTEDVALTASGTRTVSDIDHGESQFVAGVFAGAYGTLTLASDGMWSYALGNGSAAVQLLNTGDTVVDTITVHSLDGTASSIAIAIHGQTDPGLIINGTRGNDLLIGTPGNDTINGRAGVDTMSGGIGDDTYFVSNRTDVVSELADQGHDTIFSAVSFTLSANVEDLKLTGSANTTGNGNTQDNVITGNTGNNTLTGYEGNDLLDGSLGADTMKGGAGDDDFVVDDLLDVVQTGTGYDSVHALLSSYTMGTGLDELVFIGIGSFSGTGNGASNAITGGAGADSLSGLGGDDILNGGAGADTYTGGTGIDTFVFNALEANGDVVTDFQGAGARSGDSLTFYGFGEGTLTKGIGAGHYIVTADAAHGGISEEIIVTGTKLDLSATTNDFHFLI